MEWIRNKRLTLLLPADIVIINLSYISALFFVFSYKVPASQMKNYISSALVITTLYIICFRFFKLYESLWTCDGLDEFFLCMGGCVTGGTLPVLYGAVIGPRIPYSVSALGAILSFILAFGFRMSWRVHRRVTSNYNIADKSIFKKVLIIGAGSAGTIIIDEMKKHPEMGYRPAGLIDDNKHKIGKTISGVRVLGDRSDIKRMAKEMDADEIILAIPSLQADSKRELIRICNEAGCKTKTLPGIHDLLNEDVTLMQVRDVNVEDLLGREPVILDFKEISEYLKGKTVLVTGGGGSIGSELCRQIARFNPGLLLILDCYENSAYDLYNELSFNNDKLNLKVIIATVTDKKRLEKIFSEYRPEVVFHAAAHKHVPLMEENPTEAIKNNVFGTLNVAECADKFGTRKFVMISTDKAVNPTSIMGASKRICEMIVQAMDKQSKTDFVAVRFGNVLGSNGSVVPLFKKQIANGGPVTVTSRYITRYFMTISEAAQLVLQAGAYAEGGEVFVLDMGKPIKIYDLACDLIKLSGLEPHKDIKIQITGLRPGEKLYEELLMAEEGLNKTAHKKIFIGKPTFSDIEVLKRSFDEMKFIIENGSKDELIRKINDLVPTYRRPDSGQDEPSHEEIAVTSRNERVAIGNVSAV